jgi:hypothetical protein
MKAFGRSSGHERQRHGPRSAKAVEDYLNGGRWKLVAEFTEVESGKRSDRPELEKALMACRKHKAKLVIGDMPSATAPRPALRQPKARGVKLGGFSPQSN